MSLEQQAASLNAERRKRVNKLKKIIIGAIVTIITLLLLACGILLANVVSTKKQIKRLKKENEKLIEENEELSARLEESMKSQVDAEVSTKTEGMQNEQGTDSATQEVAQEGVKHVYLTFDDGPSENTGAVLDILKQYDVKATFFVIGKTDQTSMDLYRRIVAEGHSLAIHSYSHRYTQIYESLDSFKNDVLSLQALLKEATGKEVHLYRFPGGSSNTVSKVPIEDCIRFLSENGFTYFDWNATNGDATGKQISTEEMVANVMTDFQKYENLTVLMHDGAGKKQTTEALPAVIEQIKAQGAQILPITEDTKPVQHRKVESVVGG